MIQSNCEAWRAANLSERFEEAIAADEVKGFGEVDECNVQR